MNHIENHTMQWLLLLFHIEHLFFVISKIIVIRRKMQWSEHGFLKFIKKIDTQSDNKTLFNTKKQSNIYVFISIFFD